MRARFLRASNKETALSIRGSVAKHTLPKGRAAQQMLYNRLSGLI